MDTQNNSGQSTTDPVGAGPPVTRVGGNDDRQDHRRPTATLTGTAMEFRKYWIEFWWGMALVILLVFGKFVFESTTAGRDFEEFTYARLQRTLAARPDHNDTNALVIDIGELERVEFNVNGISGRATPREPLQKIIEELLEQEPRAIGVDVDFSPEDSSAKGEKTWHYMLGASERTAAKMDWS